MNPLLAAFLGIVQGLTEFLPVSSSGHLVIFQNLFLKNIEEPPLFFDCVVHLGTLVAVTIFYRRRLWQIATAPLRRDRAEMNTLLFIALSTLATIAVVLPFEDVFERLFESTTMAGVALLITGTLLLSTRLRRETGTAEITWKLALLIGAVQGLAVTPGISRSGSTIAVAMLLGVAGSKAAEYSFIMSIPAILGATLRQFMKLESSSYDWTLAGIGFFTSAFVGFAALGLLIFIVKKGGLHRFAPYCFAVGSIAIALGLGLIPS